MATDKGAWRGQAKHRYSVAGAERTGQKQVIWKPGLNPRTTGNTACYALIIYRKVSSEAINSSQQINTV